jgi:undecaprenyl-diphosphatase
VVFDAMLHVGTAGAVVWFERRQIVDWIHSTVGRRLLGLLVVGVVAFVVVALPLRATATAAFLDPTWVGVALIVTGVVVASTRLLPGGSRTEGDMTWRQVVVVGLMQGLAVFPGLSRSGLTIAAGLGSGLQRTWAARFSFLLGVPAILGVAVVEVSSARTALLDADLSFIGACLLGTVAAGISGFFALGIASRSGWLCSRFPGDYDDARTGGSGGARSRPASRFASGGRCVALALSDRSEPLPFVDPARITG